MAEAKSLPEDAKEPEGGADYFITTRRVRRERASGGWCRRRSRKPTPWTEGGVAAEVAYVLLREGGGRELPQSSPISSGGIEVGVGSSILTSTARSWCPG